MTKLAIVMLQHLCALVLINLNKGQSVLNRNHSTEFYQVLTTTSFNFFGQETSSFGAYHFFGPF